MTATILVSLALILFIVYNAIIISKLGLPWSLSESYYRLEAYHKHYGWFFSAFMIFLAALLIPSWIIVSESTEWMSNFTFLAFLSGASMIFVGAAPHYKGIEEWLHTVAAILCGVCALLWDFLVGWDIYYLPMLAALIPIIVASITKTWKTSREYWLEMIAFVSTFAMVLTKAIQVYFVNQLMI